jgi:hypothetical protein
MKDIFPRFSVFGFSGSRCLGDAIPPSVLEEAAAAVPPGSRILVGCAAGVDAYFRSRFPAAEVFAVASGRWGSGRGAFAARSAACVRAVTAAGGLWVSFPSSPCPAGLRPSSSQSRCFGGFAAGSWSSLALALGFGVPCLVRLPDGVAVPKGWGLSPVAGCSGWLGCDRVLGRGAVQLALF